MAPVPEADAARMAELIAFYCNALRPIPVLTEVVKLLAAGDVAGAETHLRSWKAMTYAEWESLRDQPPKEGIN